MAERAQGKLVAAPGDRGRETGGDVGRENVVKLVAAEKDLGKFVAAKAKRDWGKSVAAKGDRGKLMGDIQRDRGKLVAAGRDRGKLVAAEGGVKSQGKLGYFIPYSYFPRN